VNHSRPEHVELSALRDREWDQVTTAAPGRRFPAGVWRQTAAASGVYASIVRAVKMPGIILVLLAALCGCNGGGSLVPDPSRIYRVLFIGNSLTYTNNLPLTVSMLASSAGDSFEVASVALPGLALVDHAAGQSEAISMIGSRHWDYVVLQQGPSSLPISRDTLIVGSEILDRHIRAVGARTAELMVWPAKVDIAAFDAVLGSYQEAARAVDGVFLPGGEAWRATWAVDPSVPLYGDDDFHPSELGTYLTALVVYEGLTGRPAESLSPVAIADGRSLNVSAGTVRLLQSAAHEVVVRFTGAQD
jgi:hypothetical protein